ncbi:restriction endonuclease subunit S [Vibrio crassostreae]|uniref:restriction endonuclease subunit S n=1 Tax=Vibrio crassostreae TaxID=246167 RepID=UPI004068D985
MKLDFDKKDWIPVKLSDVVVKKEENDRENAQKRFDRFLKVEHMDAGSLHIKRWSSQEVGDEINPTFYKIFRKGQILFPTRNPHLRRTALASFDGICGEKTLTIEANRDIILPEFLPFLFHSESFYAHTTSSIVGSTNPHCRWRDVANYEFLLPPKHQQAQLARLLWATDEVIEKEKELLLKVDIIYERLLLDFFQTDSKYEKVELGSLVKIKSGNSPSTFEFTSQQNGCQFFKVKDLNETTKFQDFAKEWVEPIQSKVIMSNSVIFPKRGAAIMTNKVRITTEECHVDTNIMALSIKDDKLLSAEFLYYFLYFKKLYKIADTSQIPQINNVHINPYPIHLPPLSTQNEFVSKVNNLLESRKVIVNKNSSSLSLQKSLINQVF